MLNFGLPAPIDVQIVGPKSARSSNLAVAEDLRKRVATVPGAVDVHIHQVANTPDLRVLVDRTRAGARADAARCGQRPARLAVVERADRRPNFWLDPVNGVSYQVAVMTPQYRSTRLALENTPVIDAGREGPAAARQPGRPRPRHHADQRHALQHRARRSTSRRRAGRGPRPVSTRVEQIVDKMPSKQLPRGHQHHAPRAGAEHELVVPGLALGIIVRGRARLPADGGELPVWLDPLIILMALPGALGGNPLDAVRHAAPRSACRR